MPTGLPVARTGPDRVALRLDDAERRVLASLVDELRAELDDPASADPGGSLARLFPPAFPDDEAAQAAWADLVTDDLLDGRRDRVAVVEATLAADGLDDEQAAAWLGVLNDLRLALGERLGVTDEDADRLPEPGDPDAMRRAVFAYLGWLVGCFVDALEPTLPAVPDDEDDEGGDDADQATG